MYPNLLTQTFLGNFDYTGPLGSVIAPAGAPGSAPRLLTTAISRTIGVLTITAGVWFIFQLIIGGFSWLQAAGDKQAAENARKRLQNAFVGLMIVVASYSLAGIVGLFLGIDILGVGEAIINLAVQ